MASASTARSPRTTDTGAGELAEFNLDLDSPDPALMIPLVASTAGVAIGWAIADEI